MKLYNKGFESPIICLYNWFFDVETNVLASYVCSLQVYIQEFSMRMCHLFGAPSMWKQKQRGLSIFWKRTALISVVLIFYLKQHKNLQKIPYPKICNTRIAGFCSHLAGLIWHVGTYLWSSNASIIGEDLQFNVLQ